MQHSATRLKEGNSLSYLRDSANVSGVLPAYLYLIDYKGLLCNN